MGGWMEGWRVSGGWMEGGRVGGGWVDGGGGGGGRVEGGWGGGGRADGGALDLAGRAVCVVVVRSVGRQRRGRLRAQWLLVCRR